MNIEDYTLGNYIYDNFGKVSKIYSMGYIDIFLKRKGDDGVLQTSYITSDGIEPIPLTDEILENNGFERNLHYFSINKHRHIVELWNKEEYYDLIIDSGKVNIKIKFVHELQNAMSLCKLYDIIEL